MLLVFAPWPGSLWSVYTIGPGNFTHGLIWAAPNTPVTRYIADGDQPWFLEYHWRGPQVVAGNAYVLSGLVLLVILGYIALVSSAPVRSPANWRPPPTRTQPAPASQTRIPLPRDGGRRA